MDERQIADRAQFRRYAEAALSGMTQAARCYSTVADEAFVQAAAMMLAENKAFEHFQLLALKAITPDERNRHAEGS